MSNLPGTTIKDPAEGTHNLPVAEGILAQLGLPLSQARFLGNTILSSSETNVDDSTVSRLWEAQGVVKEAPRYQDQLKDEDRQASFSFTTSDISYKRLYFIPKGYVSGQDQEINGLREVDSLLTRFLETEHIIQSSAAAKHLLLKEQAEDIQENLSFIGKREFEQAARGIGIAWRSYLDEDPRRKLCILTVENELEASSETRKSDSYLLNQILETFSDEDLKKYSGKIVDSMNNIAEPDTDNTRVVILDDWVLSGNTLRKVIFHLAATARFRSFFKQGQVEINLIAAQADLVANGLELLEGQPKAGSVRTRAFYQTHYAPTAAASRNSYISGLHSPANFGFGDTLRKIARIMRPKSDSHIKSKTILPKLVSLVPDYRQSVPTIVFRGNNELRRRTPEEMTEARAVKLAGLLALSQELQESSGLDAGDSKNGN